jgi:hypothetical protein
VNGFDLRSIARALGRAEKCSGGWLASCPLPLHGKGRGDRNPSLSLGVGDNGLLLARCFGGCDARDVLAEMIRRLGLYDGSVTGSVAERYLREVRGYRGMIPGTLGFLPARGDHPPALIAAYGFAAEPEPGVLAIDEKVIPAVHLIRLKYDGSGKAGVKPKVTIGAALGFPIMLAPANDLLALAIGEGVENLLSVHAATGVGAWASGGDTFLSALVAAVPDYAELVWIVQDPDRTASNTHASSPTACVREGSSLSSFQGDAPDEDARPKRRTVRGRGRRLAREA